MRQAAHVMAALLAPWAILPEMYERIFAVFERWSRGERADLAAIEAAAGKPLKNEPARYTVTPEGVAVIPVQGVIAKRMGMLSEISGGASTEAIAADFREALGRADVKAILLDIDSPGGAVDGTLELAREIYAARGKKPLAAFGDGLMASAAMWIGAAADEVYLSSETARAGSIGIVTRHTDISAMEEKQGVKTTVLTAGKYKALGNEYEPLSEEARTYIQENLDYVYGLFVGDIAAFRGTDVKTVLAKMADGRMFTAPQAVAAGLVDGIMSKTQVIQRLLGKTGAASAAKPGVNARNAGGAGMELDELRAQHPELAAALLAEGKTAGLAEGKALGIEEGRKLGAEAERERIRAVYGCLRKGNEKVIETAMFDGKSTATEAKAACFEAQSALGAEMLAKLAAGAPPAAPASAGAEEPAAITPQQEKVNGLFGVSAEQFRKYGTPSK